MSGILESSDADGYSGGSIATQFFSVTAVTILGLVKFLIIFSSTIHFAIFASPVSTLGGFTNIRG